MAVNRLSALAAGAPVPVFAAVGGGASQAVDGLRADQTVEFVLSPRHATVLLAAGCFPHPLLDALRRVHDQIPHRRAAVWWTGAPDPRLAEILGDPVVVAGDAGACVEALRSVHRAVTTGARASSPDLLPDEPPAPWEGVGPFGQGGEGMMGGTPYGRPMAMTGPDRDGLELDRLELRVGPFHPALPPGLVLDVVLQGGVIQEVGPVTSPFRASLPPPAGTALAPDDRHLFARAQREPVPLAALETARAAYHLRLLGHGLDLHGLPALARRTYRLAAHLSPRDVATVARLGRLARLALRPGTAGAGRLEGDPEAGDTFTRWQQRVAVAEAALRLAAGAPAAAATPTAGGEAPPDVVSLPGAIDRVELLRRLPDLLAGRDWHDAMATIASLDLDLEATGAPQRVTTP